MLATLAEDIPLRSGGRGTEGKGAGAAEQGAAAGDDGFRGGFALGDFPAATTMDEHEPCSLPGMDPLDGTRRPLHASVPSLRARASNGAG
jgi:hypothetical protein